MTTRQAVAVAALPILIYLCMRAVPSSYDAVGITQLEPAFIDMRNVTTAVECDRQGIDPLRSNPCDPTQRPLNYPRVWVKALSPLGIGAGATVPLALIAIAVFSGALALLMRNQPGGVWWWAATIVSPPVMLVVERGNTDLVVFAALVIAALALERPALAAASWLATVVLKLFTVAAAPVLLLHARPRRWMLAALGVAVAYAALSFRDIRVIAHVVPQDVDNSYGSSLLPARIAGSLEPANYKIIGWVIAGLVGIGALVRGWRHNFRAENGGVAEFQVAASIFIATYLVGVSFDYREIFLLLALPFTLRNPSVETRLLQVLIVASMWLGPGGRIGGLADDVVELVLFAVLVSLLTATFARTFRASTDGIRLRAR